MNYKLFLLFLLSACNLCYGQQVGGIVKDDDAAVKVWIVDDELQEEGIASLLVQVAEKYKEGVHRLEGIRKKGPNREYITITITRSSSPTPQPNPGPVPGPVPVDPIPIVNPIRVPGFRVLVVEESALRATLPKGQREALASVAVEEYLKKKCTLGVDGKSPEYRFFDPNDNTSRLPKVWQDAMALPRTKLPWVVISNGKEGTSEPLPNTEAEFLALLKKYGGE